MKWLDGNKDSPTNKTELKRICDGIFSEQKKWVSNWKSIRDNINPYLGCFDGDQPNQGNRRDNDMINTNAIIASNTFAAGMHNGITSPTRPWVKLTLRDTDTAEIEGVRWWCDDVTKSMLDVCGHSNFYHEAHKFYKELGVFGTAVMMIVDDEDTVIRCKTLTCGQYAIGTDHTGRVKRFARLLKMTVSEMVDMFTLDNCPPNVKSAYENKRYNDYHDVYHLIIKNKDMVKGKLDKWSKEYSSYYWCAGLEDGEFLDVGGYDEFPVMCARWDTVGSDIYGYGPGGYSLGDAKAVQVVDEDVHIAIKKGIDPPMVAPADVMMAGGVNTMPNGITYYQREMGDSAVRPASQVQLNIDDAMSLVQRKEQTVDKHFFVDLFRMLEGIDNGNITAREIIERVQEKMSLIGPALDNLQSEFLSNVVDRIFGIMQRAGILPVPDESVMEVISEQTIKVEYVSVMAQDQKMSGINALEQLSSFVGNLAQLFPQAADKFDADEAIDNMANMLGTDAGVVVSNDKVAQKRQAAQQAQQAQQAMAMAQQGAGVAKDLSQAQTGQGSALDALMPGLGAMQQ